MKSGICRQCQGRNVRTNKGNAHQGEHHYLGASGLKGIYCHVYVCTDCGYLEDYVDRGALARIAERWSKVTEAI